MRPTHAVRLLLLAGAAPSCALLSAPAFAQSAPAAGPEEIIVTAARREQALVEVPVAVTAISGATLQARGLVQIEDFAAQVPGFSINKEGRTGIRLVLRGQNVGGSGASVATMIDETVLNSATANGNGALVTPNLETYDMARIEVLRGPQGTLYGATAQGGLLKFVTNAPELDRFGGEVIAGVESILDHETGWNVRGHVNAPIIDGKLALRVTGFYADVPGFIDNPLLGLEDVNGGTRWGGRASLLFQPDDTFTIRLTASTQRDDYGAEGYADVVGSPFAANGETDASFQLTRDGFVANRRLDSQVKSFTDFYNLFVEKEFGAVAATSSTSFAKVNRRMSLDISDQAIAPGLSLAAGIGPLFGQPIGARLDQLNEHRKFIQEVRLASTATDGISWQGGLFYTHEDVEVQQDFAALSPSNPDGPELTVLPFFPGIGGLGLGGNSSPSKYDELSAFADVTVPLGERFEISVGGRYTKTWQSQQVTTEAGLLSGAPIAFPRAELDEDKFTWSIAPRFKLSEDVSLYARVATGFRPGGFVTPIPGAPADFPTSFTSDTTINYELGAKGDIADGLIGFDLALYQIDWSDVQIVTSFQSSVTNLTYTVVGNGGDARSRGFEWNLALRPAEGFLIGWAGAYTDATLRDDAPGLGGQSGDRLPYVPEFSSSLSADYTGNITSAAKIALGATWNHVSARHSNFTNIPILSNNVRIPGYDTLDARLGVEFSRYRVQLLLRNLTDERGITDYRNATGFQSRLGQANFIQPFTVQLNVGASF